MGDWTIAGGDAAGERLLAAARPPTAIVAASDEMAVGVLCAARRRGVRVPEELSVVGFDDHEFAVTHGLTTVSQPVDALGAAAAAVLVDVLRHGQPPARRSITLPTQLVVRTSSGPASAVDAVRARR